MAHHLTPLAVCERIIGGPETIGRLLGIDVKSPYQWRYPRGSREAGDMPRVTYLRRLLAYSEQHGLGLKAEHLLRGAPEAEIEAILAERAARDGMAAE